MFNELDQKFPIKDLLQADFPETLRNIPNPPESLRIRGTMPPVGTKYLCVIGARKSTEYGKQACRELISGLKGYPICIVSGLALGIDSMAHELAIEYGLCTISFPGSGLNWNILYPPSKIPVAKKILESGGAILSRFADNMSATKWTFPKRNALMAGISHTTLIIEARVKSGTLITADYALSFGRDLMVVPGSIFSNTSYASNLLFSRGAAPAASSKEILEMLGFDTREKVPVDSASLSPEENSIYERLASPIKRDDLIREMELPAGYLNSILVDMEMRGIISEREGNLTQA